MPKPSKELEEYYQDYQQRPDAEIERRLAVKKIEIETVVSQTNYSTKSHPVRIAILGCGDARYIAGHQELLDEQFGTSAELITFDLNVFHLAGEPNVFEHDVTKPIPEGPFDITIGHVLLKFIESAKQFAVLKNSFDALRSPGLSVHIFGPEEISGEDTGYGGLKSWQYPVDLDRHVEKLNELGIQSKRIVWSIKGIERMPIPIRR